PTLPLCPISVGRRPPATSQPASMARNDHDGTGDTCMDQHEDQNTFDLNAMPLRPPRRQPHGETPLPAPPPAPVALPHEEEPDAASHGARALASDPSSDGKQGKPSSSPSAVATLSPLAPRLTGRARLARAGCVGALLLLVLALLLLPNPATQAALVGLLHLETPTATPRLSIGDNRFLWEHSVPWGVLLVDGRPGPDVRTSGILFDETGDPVAAPPYTFALPRGRHTLEYRAAPFPTLRCTISVPAALSDTCPLVHNVPPFLVKQDDLHSRYLDLRATLDRLSPEQWTALTAATQATLNQIALAAAPAPGTLVASGDHYLAATGPVVVPVPPSLPSP